MESEPTTEKKLSKSQLRRREDIIEAALKVFERDGFEAARISDIANEAEVAKGTVYLYFETKEALLEGVIHDYVLPAIERVTNAAAEKSGTAADRLKRQISIISERLGYGPMRIILRLMISEGPKQDRLRTFYYENVVSPGIDAIRKTLVAGEASGEFKPGAAEISPQVFAGPPLMASIWGMLFDDFEPLDRERLMQDHLRTVLSGIRQT